MSEEEKKEDKKKSASPLVIVSVFFLLLGAVLAGGAVYSVALKYPQVLGLKTTVLISEEEEAKKLLESVQKIIDIPQDEEPVITTVSDVEKPKNDIAFKNAQNGDKIITYLTSKRVILFRPTENKIIDVGFISETVEATPTPVPPTPAPTVAPVVKTMRIFIFNGTSSVGAAKTMETTLVATNKDIQIVGRVAANKTNYATTLVIDLLGTRVEDANKLAKDLNATVATLPEGEKAPENADFLVIIGKASVVATPVPTAQ